MSSFVKPTKKAQRQALKPKGFQKPNPIRALREQEERRQAVAAAAAAEATASKQGSLAVSARPQCPNKACLNPNVVDGICTTCGRIADDSNIVAEVQFGETSSGAAVVQGSYIGADQGGVRSIGPAFRRVGGTDEREKSIREAKSLIQGYAQQLRLSDATVNTSVQIYKLASEANFIQGRTLVAVAAVCLYGACRSAPPCKIMLIDLADLTHIDVFKLGRIFKALNRAVPFCGNGEDPVFPEDLIYRFASKLEFHHMTNKVALDAVRLVHRMKADWMVMGRRPSGICGACLLIAARINNFRRTVREVVYIVKVTNHTIQKRLEEFTETASSDLTVDDFLTMDLSTAHDPPSFYRKSEAYKAKMEEKRRKRKRKEADDGEAEREGEGVANVSATTSDKLTPDAIMIPPSALSAPDLSSLPIFNYRRDKDGYIIPPIPSKITPTEPALLEPNSNAALDGLVKEFGDQGGNGNSREDSQVSDVSAEPGPEKGGRKKRQTMPQLPVTEEWEDDEADIEDEISEIMNDPETYEHAKAFGNAEQRARVHTMWALQQQPPKEVSMAPDVGEDEFANDPEVMNCVLTPDEAKIKELLWVNENKEWLRLSQERVFKKKMEAQRPKATRKRKKKARMGEGQTSPASTPGEAAVSVMKERGWSKRINYDAIKNMFDEPGRPGPGSVGGSEITSRRTSLAGSIFGANDGSDQADESSAAEDEEYGEDDYGNADDDEDTHMYGDDDQGDDQDVEDDDEHDDGD